MARTKSSSIKDTDAMVAAHATAPRVTLAAIEAAIANRYEMTGDQLVPSANGKSLDSLKLLSLCILVMKNGFVVVGKSAPVSADNYNFAIGCKLAYEDALRQLWPLMDFAMKDKMQ